MLVLEEAPKERVDFWGFVWVESVNVDVWPEEASDGARCVGEAHDEKTNRIPT